MYTRLTWRTDFFYLAVYRQNAFRRYAIWTMVFILPFLFADCSMVGKRGKMIHRPVSSYEKGELFFHLNQYDSAYMYLGEALGQARTRNDTKSVFEALNMLIELDVQTGQYDSCKQRIALFEPYLATSITDSLKAIGQSTIYASLATIALREGNFTQAEALYQRVLKYLENTDYDLRRTAFTYLNIGLIYRNLNKYSQAIASYIKAAEFADSLQLPSVRYSAFILIGQNYMQMNQYENALYYYKQAEQQIENPNIQPYKSELYIAYGNLFRLRSQYDSALHYLYKARNYPYTSAPAEKADILVRLGETYLEMHEYDSSEQYLQEGLSSMNVAGDRVGLYNVMTLLSQKRMMEGKTFQSGYYLRLSDSLAQLSKPPVQMLMNHKRRYAQYLQQTGNFRAAAAYYNEYLVLADSANNIESQWRANELEYQYQTAQKERLILAKNIALQNQQLSNTKLEYRLYISFAIFVLILTVFGFFLYRLQIIRKMERQELLLEQKKLLTTFQYKTLNSQISPHFLFNSLNNIWYIFHKHNEQEAYQYMTSMTQLVRKSLEVTEYMVHPLADEISFIRDYLKLEKLRFEGRLDYSIQVDESIDMQRPIVAMMLQQYIENALKHGLSLKEHDGFIKVEIHPVEHGIEIRIADNGVGLGKSAIEKGKSTGRGNKMFAELIKFYNLRNTNKVDVQIARISDKEDFPGTRVTIFIPDGYSFQIDA